MTNHTQHRTYPVFGTVILGAFLALAGLALPRAADARVHVWLGIGIPAPIYVAPPPVVVAPGYYGYYPRHYGYYGSYYRGYYGRPYGHGGPHHHHGHHRGHQHGHRR